MPQQWEDEELAGLVEIMNDDDADMAPELREAIQEKAQREGIELAVAFGDFLASFIASGGHPVVFMSASLAVSRNISEEIGIPGDKWIRLAEKLSEGVAAAFAAAAAAEKKS